MSPPFLAGPWRLPWSRWACRSGFIGNIAARLFGSHALDEFPFPDLTFVATTAAFLIALLILTT